MYLNTAIALIFTFTYLDIPNYIFLLNSSILPKYLYYFLFVTVSPFIIFNFKEFLLYMASPYALWALAYSVLYSLDLLDGNDKVIDYIREIDQYLILSVFFGFAISLVRTDSFEYLFPILATISTACVITDFIKPEIFYPLGTELTVLGRASAMYINPTRAGEAIMLTSSLAIPVIPIHYRMLALFLAGIGVFVTFSRSAIIVWLLFCIFLLIARKTSKFSLIVLVFVITLLPLLIASFTNYVQDRQDLTWGSDNITERLDFFKKPNIEDDSGQERLQVLEAATEIFMNNPVFGAGTGITTFWSHRGGAHNQFLTIGAEHGIIGIALWIWLLVIMWRGKYFQDRIFQPISATMIFLFSFFTHNMINPLYWLITFALVSGRRQT